MYKEKILITSNDVDHHLKLKISSLFRFIQQVSTNHSEKLGFGRSVTNDQGLAWVITRTHIEIYDLPEMNDEIYVATHPGEQNKFIFPRYYMVYDKHGKLLVSCSSLWVVIDSNTRRVIVKPFGDKIYKGEKHKDDIPLPDRVNLDEVSLVQERKVLYSDIDLNGHMNNVKYIEYMIDLHDKSFYDKYTVSDILINYEKECHDSDIVKLYMNDNINCSIKGEVNDVTSFSAIIKFKERKA